MSIVQLPYIIVVLWLIVVESDILEYLINCLLCDNLFLLCDNTYTLW
jgi:hypothetical protein